MKIIVKDRQQGKTTDLIALAAERGGYIVCANQTEVKRVADEARKRDQQIAFPITFDELLERRFYGRGIKEFYIDNAELLLQRLCVGVPLEAITLDSGGRDRER